MSTERIRKLRRPARAAPADRLPPAAQGSPPALLVKVHDPRSPHARWVEVPAIRCTAKGRELVLVGYTAGGLRVTVTLDNQALCTAFDASQRIAAVSGRRS